MKIRGKMINQDLFDRLLANAPRISKQPMLPNMDQPVTYQAEPPARPPKPPIITREQGTLHNVRRDGYMGELERDTERLERAGVPIQPTESPIAD